MRRERLQDVELIDAAPTVATAPRRRPLAVAVGVLALVVVLGGTQAVLSARDDAALARLQSIPGVIRPVDGTLEVVRRLAVDESVELTGEGGALVTAEDGTLTYRWFAPDDAGWVRELLPATPAAADEWVLLAGSACEPDPATQDTDRIVCFVTDRAQVVTARGAVLWRPATTTQIIVLDPADGSIVAQWSPEHGTSAAQSGEVVVVASATDDTLLVTGHDTLTGAERWTLRLPSRPGAGPVPGAAAVPGAGPGPGPVSVFPAGDLVAVVAPSGALRLLARDGAIVRDDLVLTGDGALDPMPRWDWSTTADGTLAVPRQEPDGQVRTTLVAADGDPAADRTIDGYIVPAAVDDGSVPGLLLTSNGSVHAWDTRTGRSLWSADVPVKTDALVLRGRVYLTTTARQVVALDGRSGRELWRSDELVGLTASALLTDGVHVLLATDRTGRDAEPTLVAFDPASGEVAFRAPYPPGVTGLQVVGHTLVGQDQKRYDQVELG